VNLEFKNLKYLSFGGLVLLLVSGSFLLFTHLISGTSYLENSIEKSIISRKEKIEKKILDGQIPFNKRKNLHAIFILNNEELTYWSNPLEKVPEIIYKDSIFSYNEEGESGIVTTRSFGDSLLCIKFPVLKQAELQTDLHFIPFCEDEKLTLFNDYDFELTNTDSPFYSSLLYSFLIILFFGALLFVFPAIWKSLKKWSLFDRHEAITYLMLILAFLFYGLAYVPALSDYWPTARINDDWILKLNPFTIFFIASFVLLWLATITSEQFDKTAFRKKLSSSKFLAFLSYISISIFAAFSIGIIQNLFLDSGINYNLERIFALTVEEVFYLLLFLVIFSAFFQLSQSIYRLINGKEWSIWIKLIGILSSVLILYLFTKSEFISLPALPLILSYLIFVFTLDLYQDRKSINSTWIFTWMLLISSFLSFLIFYVDFKKDQLTIERKLEQVFIERDSQFENGLTTGDAALLEDASYIMEWKEIEKGEYLDLEKDYIPVGSNLAFNPLNGDYLQKEEVLNELMIPIKIYYKNKSKLNDNYKIPELHLKIYHEGKLFKTINDFSYNESPDLAIIDFEFGKQDIDGYRYHYHRGHTSLSVLFAEELPGLLRPVSLFSLLFFILSLLIFLLSLVNTKVKFLPGQMDLRFFEYKSLRNRIQISIISLVISSFFIIGVVSNYYLSNMADKTEMLLWLQEGELIRNEINKKIDFDSWLPLENELKEFGLKKAIRDSKEILFYNNDGTLILDKRSFNVQEVREKMSLMPFDILDALKFSNEKEIIYSDLKGFKGVILKLGNETKNAYAFVPGKSENFSLHSINNIFATFLNIYSLLFILSGAIAIALANSITKPIEILGEKLKGLKLSNKNEMVQWKNEDEIGALISIYNDMILKLSDNAKVMAKVERDSAWKEMAKQVAHEIKNPLTPLKLNIQYLESKVRMSPDDAPELIQQLAPSLIEQIDNLSQIASEFSNFAQLPTARNEKVRLNEIVKTVHDFFRKREDLKFQLYLPINDVLVFADKNHLVRILNNVVKNAIQSIPPERDGEIILRLYRKEDNAIVQITDNGSGIPEDMHDKVFSPNFTTKSSGTGLGLAISTNMLESFNGQIYFETKEDEGTDFFIEVPLMRLEDNFGDEQRVMLDDF